MRAQTPWDLSQWCSWPCGIVSGSVARCLYRFVCRTSRRDPHAMMLKQFTRPLGSQLCATTDAKTVRPLQQTCSTHAYCECLQNPLTSPYRPSPPAGFGLIWHLVAGNRVWSSTVSCLSNIGPWSPLGPVGRHGIPWDPPRDVGSRLY